MRTGVAYDSHYFLIFQELEIGILIYHQTVIIYMMIETFRNIPIEVYLYDESLDSASLNRARGSDYLNMDTEAIREQRKSWASTIKHEVDGHSEYAIVLNSELSDAITNTNLDLREKIALAYLLKSVLEHEYTHVFIGKKCRYNDSHLNEGVAWARGLLSLRKFGVSLPDEVVESSLKSYKKTNGLDPKKVDDCKREYISAADEIGDDVSLQLVRDSLNDWERIVEKVNECDVYEDVPALEIFKENVRNYKNGMKHFFSQILQKNDDFWEPEDF